MKKCSENGKSGLDLTNLRGIIQKPSATEADRLLAFLGVLKNGGALTVATLSEEQHLYFIHHELLAQRHIHIPLADGRDSPPRGDPEGRLERLPEGAPSVRRLLGTLGVPLYSGFELWPARLFPNARL